MHILTLHWSKEDSIRLLNNSITPCLNGIDYTWHIRDNNSKDNSVNTIKSLGNKNIKLYEYHTNDENFSQGMNFLFNQSKANDEDNILLLNNDLIFIDKKSISNMIGLLKNDIAIVGAKLNYMDNPKLIQHCGVLYTSKYLLPYHFRDKQVENANDKINRLYPAVTGAVMLTKAKYYKEADMLDEKFIFCYEDIDFCMKLSNKYKIAYCGQAGILHDSSASLKKNPVNKKYLKDNIKHFHSKWIGSIAMKDWDKEYVSYNNKDYKVI